MVIFVRSRPILVCSTFKSAKTQNRETRRAHHVVGSTRPFGCGYRGQTSRNVSAYKEHRVRDHPRSRSHSLIAYCQPHPKQIWSRESSSQTMDYRSCCCLRLNLCAHKYETHLLFLCRLAMGRLRASKYLCARPRRENRDNFKKNE